MKNVILIKDQDSLQQCTDYLESLDLISLDTETQGFSPHTKKLLTLQVGNKDRQYVIDCQQVDIIPLKSILESKLIIAHNMKFDWQFMYHAGIDIRNIFCTFLAECILTTGFDSKERDVSLKGVALKYLEKDMDKSIRGKINYLGLTEEVVDYAANDIEHLESIMDAQVVLIKHWDLERVMDLENKVVRVFAMMEYNGIAFDSTKLTNVANQLTTINADLVKKLDITLIEDSITNKKLARFIDQQVDMFSTETKTIVSWTSPLQKKQILNAYGLNVDGVSDKILQKLKSRNRLVPLFIELSKFEKLENTFGSTLLEYINPVTNRIHSTVWQIVSTGRISMSDPPLQQIPSHSALGQTIKSCFIASKGGKIVSADFSSMELRIVAEYSQDPTWVKAFIDDGDLHSILCAMTFEIPIEDVKKPFPGKPDISYRYLQKVINFMLIYGGSKFKLSEIAQISIEEADRIIKKFFSSIPKVEEFLNMLARVAVKNGYIRTDTIYKRIRWFPKLDRSDGKTIGDVERASKNSIPQGTNADIIKQALIDLQNTIDDNNYPVKILLSIHDELITDCLSESFAEEWKTILEKTMINAAKLIIKSIPVKVEGVISDYWTK